MPRQIAEAAAARVHALDDVKASSKVVGVAVEPGKADDPVFRVPTATVGQLNVQLVNGWPTRAVQRRSIRPTRAVSLQGA
ncbi:hypothetical protein ASD37_14890 [Mycobacterium sp. Root135]|nr:hypothetical protein ASD37_14890 [Mycobacterium sp. Root135]